MGGGAVGRDGERGEGRGGGDGEVGCAADERVGTEEGCVGAGRDGVHG